MVSHLMLYSLRSFYYGPDSVYAEFDADTCLEILGLPTCGAWVPDPMAFIKLLTHQTQPFLGAWCLIGIVAASMSTADGAILAMGTVWSHNITRQLDSYFPSLVTPENLLMAARLSTIPFSLAATIIASEVRETGYLLIVAFDIMLAGVVAPLFGCFYAKNPSPRAAFCSLLAGVIVRVVLEFALPKDGYLILPYNLDEFFDYGPAASAKLPTFFDAPAEDLWDPSVEPCDSAQLEDCKYCIIRGWKRKLALVDILSHNLIFLCKTHRHRSRFAGGLFLRSYRLRSDTVTRKIQRLQTFVFVRGAASIREEFGKA